MAIANDASDLIKMLESNNAEKAQDVKNIVHEILSTNPKDTWLVCGLVEYYVRSYSSRCLDILIEVREPHDKHLLDKICDCMKNVSTRVSALNLLGQVISKEPSWLYKIGTHSLISHLLKLLKTENDVVVIFSALLSLVNLLPTIPYLISNHLNSIFEIFCRLAAWNSPKAVNIPDVYIIHLHVGLYALFHRLYGMYPCNFLSYLRSHFGSKDNAVVFVETIRPMLERVRMHPALVTASKEAEISKMRWAKRETHDIVMECARVSLDIVEGAETDLSGRGYWYASFTTEEPKDVPITLPQGPQSMSFISLSTPAFITHTVQENQYPRTPPICGDGINNNKGTLTSVEMLPVLTDSQPSSPLRKIGSPVKFPSAAEIEDFNIRRDLLKSSACHALTFAESSGEEKVSSGKFSYSLSKSSEHDDNQQSLDDDRYDDKEICEIVSQAITIVSTSGLEDSGKEDQPSERLCQRSDSVIHDEAEHFSTVEYEDCANPAFNKVVELVRSVRRLRYYSQCGPPPDIAELIPKKPKLSRSQSLPIIRNICRTPPKIQINPVPMDSSVDSSSNMTPQLAEVTSQEAETSNRDVTRVPLGLDQRIFIQPVPMPASCCYQCQNCKKMGAESLKLSPNEILDNHIKIMFGGRAEVAASGSEVATLQGQILLLQNQLHFERHRRRVHSERNRSLLAKFKKTRAFDENTLALRDQVKQQERDLVDSRDECYQLSEKTAGVISDKSDEMAALLSEKKKFILENEALHNEVNKLKNCLNEREIQQENMEKELQNTNARLKTAMLELDDMRVKLADNSKLQTELDRVKKEMILLGELQQKYREKFSSLPHPMTSNVETSSLMKSYRSELQITKKLLDTRNQQLDVLKARAAEFESQVNKRDILINEQKILLQKAKEEYSELVTSYEERNRESSTVTNQLLCHILLQNSASLVSLIPLPQHLSGYISQAIEERSEKNSDTFMNSNEYALLISKLWEDLENNQNMDVDTKDYIKKHLTVSDFKTKPPDNEPSVP